jgi:hypothetical protein
MNVDNLPTFMAILAQDIRALLMAQPDRRLLARPALPGHASDLVWDNCLLTARGFRRAHVELFSAPARFAVLHVCIFPHLNNPASIFGFDMIAGSGIATGVFLDFSAPGLPPFPNLADVPLPCGGMVFGAFRDRPAWGDIFSEAFFAIRPVDSSEVVRAAKFAVRALEFYLSALNETARRATRATGESLQTAYVLAQRRNEHTLRMLSRFTSAADARQFIDTVLFPLPSACDCASAAMPPPRF